MSNTDEEMGMTEQQFASYLNQVIGRLENAMDDESPEQALKNVTKVVKDMKEDRDSNM